MTKYGKSSAKNSKVLSSHFIIRSWSINYMQLAHLCHSERVRTVSRLSEYNGHTPPCIAEPLITTPPKHAHLTSVQNPLMSTKDISLRAY